jgi:ATP-binding cassette, subfamily C, bacterial LapB
MALVSELLGQPVSPATLARGFALDNQGRVPAADWPLVAQAQGLKAHVQAANLSDINADALPLIVLLKNGQACVLLRRPQGEEKSEARCEVLQPEHGLAPVHWGWQALLAQAQGHVLQVKATAHLDDRGDFNAQAPAGHWFWATLWHYKRYYAHVALATVVVNLLALTGSFFTLQVYDRVVPNQAYSTLWVLAAGTLLAAGFEFSARMLRAWLTDEAGRKADLVMSATLFRRVMGLRLDAKPTSAGSFSNTLREFESVREFVASATLLAVADLPFVLLFVAVIAMLTGPLAWVPVATMGVVLLATLVAQWPLRRLMAQHLKGMSRKQAIAVEAVGGLETLRAWRAEGLMQARWEHSHASVVAYSNQSRLLSAWLMGFLGFVQQASTVAIVVWGVYRIHEGLLSLGALIAAVILMSRAVAPITQVAQLGMRLQHAREALKGLNGVMALPQEREATQRGLPMPQAQGALALRDVGCRYPGERPRPALAQVNLAFKAGERVALLGRVGSGKSTLLRIAAGLLPASDGGVTLDGLDMRQIDAADVHGRIAYLGQEAQLFHGTLRENILLGDGHISPARLAQALRMTGLDTVVAEHPRGLDLPIGEQGLGLSGGQRQLVALARLLVRDPAVVLLDEPTSAMDQATEQSLLQNLTPWLQGRTVVMATHRGHWLGLVDRIVVLEQGRVVADGPRAATLTQLARGIGLAPDAGKPSN